MKIELRPEGHYLCGTDNRFKVSPFKARFPAADPKGSSRTVWMIHDAEWARDGHGGWPSPVVNQADDLDEAFQYCRKADNGEVETWPHESQFEGNPGLRAVAYEVAMMNKELKK